MPARIIIATKNVKLTSDFSQFLFLPIFREVLLDISSSYCFIRRDINVTVYLSIKCLRKSMSRFCPVCLKKLMSSTWQVGYLIEINGYNAVGFTR